jgi:hypothetical protein
MHKRILAIFAFTGVANLVYGQAGSQTAEWPYYGGRRRRIALFPAYSD